MYDKFKYESDRKESTAIAFAIASVIFALMWRFDISQYIRTDTETRDYVSNVILLLVFINLSGAIKAFVESFILQVRAWRARGKEAK